MDVLYKIEFYEDKNGVSELRTFIHSLLAKSADNKDARIQYEQIFTQIHELSLKGTNLPSNITKHIDGDIWELRPGHNRIFYFCWLGNKFVLLHHFRKKTRKTPLREIKRAKSERDDYIRRHSGQ